LEWVRSRKGDYLGDLALVWYPLKDGVVWEQCVNTDPTLVAVLVVPREREDTKEVSEAGKGKARYTATARPDPRRREPSAAERSDSARASEYLKRYYNGLLITRFDTWYTSRTTPAEDELSPFAESNFDVRLWRRFLAQQRLRAGQKVEVIGSEYNGRAAVFVGSVHRVASVCLCACSPSGDTESVEVDLRCLDPRFEIGDAVRTVPSFKGAEIRSGIVSKVDDWRVLDAEEHRRQREQFVRLYWRRSRMPAIADREIGTVDPIVVWPGDDVDLNGVAKIDVHVVDPRTGMQVSVRAYVRVRVCIEVCSSLQAT
jgi:hypothetical protein